MLHDDEGLDIVTRGAPCTPLHNVLADLIDRADVGMVQGRGGTGFLQQTVGGVLVLLGEYFNGDRALERRVVGLVDRTHSAGPDGSDDHVGSELRAGFKRHWGNIEL